MGSLTARLRVRFIHIGFLNCGFFCWAYLLLFVLFNMYNVRYEPLNRCDLDAFIRYLGKVMCKRTLGVKAYQQLAQIDGILCVRLRLHMTEWYIVVYESRLAFRLFQLLKRPISIDFALLSLSLSQCMHTHIATGKHQKWTEINFDKTRPNEMWKLI